MKKREARVNGWMIYPTNICLGMLEPQCCLGIGHKKLFVVFISATKSAKTVNKTQKKFGSSAKICNFISSNAFALHIYVHKSSSLWRFFRRKFQFSKHHFNYKLFSVFMWFRAENGFQFDLKFFSVVVVDGGWVGNSAVFSRSPGVKSVMDCLLNLSFGAAALAGALFAPW